MVRIGIRREDKNEWERRSPLTPDHLLELVDKHGLEFSVQPAPLRAFPDQDYRRTGARIDESLDGCRVVLGIKEIPADRLEAGRTYVFFSHTTKGQAANMPSLARLMHLGCSLLDYEHVRDDRGRRLIFFGRYAGHAGMLDGLWALGKRLDSEGHVTPFERVRLAHDYSSLDEAAHHVHRIGERLRHSGLADGLHPMVVGFTGSGNVYLGAREIFDRLPHVEVDPGDLEQLADDGERPRNVLYRVHFRREHRFVRADGGSLELAELERSPERYRGGLNRWLPHLTVLVHGAYWKVGQPSVVSLDDLRGLWRGGEPKLRILADISRDVNGGIEATVKPTEPGDPVYVYDLRRDQAVPGVRGEGPVVLAIDNLPCQLPVESSEHFADTLARFVPALAHCDWDRPLDELELPHELSAALIVHHGRLTPRFAYLERYLQDTSTS
jgi:alpha-aminoadipic semialdehyde synthase